MGERKLKPKIWKFTKIKKPMKRKSENLKNTQLKKTGEKANQILIPHIEKT
jgi:hypothetical protein